MKRPGWRLRVMRRIHWWPPLLGAGVKVTRMDEDYRAIDVEMRLTRLNRNVMGSHFGGSLYAMTDPFYMLMLIENLGRDYVVWDKSASIRFRRPGKGKMLAVFRITDQQIEAIREQLRNEVKVEPVFTVEVKDEAGEVVAEIQKTVHVRKKDSPEFKK